MKHSGALQPHNEHEAFLRGYDLREIDAPDPAAAWALKYRLRLQAVVGCVQAATRPGDLVLEAGSGQANCSLLLAESGRVALALDRDGRALAYAARKHEHGTFLGVAGDALHLPLPDAVCHAVLLPELLEHLPEPGAALREARRVLVPGGLLVLTTPNGTFIHEELPAYTAADHPTAALPAADGEGHLFALRAADLRRLLHESDFRRIRTAYNGSILLSDRNPLKRRLPLGLTRLASALVNRLPGAAKLSYTCLATARKE